MSWPKKWASLVGLSLLVLSGGIGAAQASCQPIRSIQQCPVGDETFTRISGCKERYFSLINDETVRAYHVGSNRPQCSGNNFPAYRSFTHEEHGRLESLVASEGYQSRKDEGYGTLAVWVEQQLTGQADPEWHGEMILWDEAGFLHYGHGSRPPNDEHKVAMKRALPLLIEAAESSETGGPERARDLARIAYLLHHTGQREAALDWMKRAEQAVGPPPPEDMPAYERLPFTEAVAHLDALALCLAGPEAFRAELCEADGIESFPGKFFFCAWRDELPCTQWPAWTGDVDGTAERIQAARRNFPRFRKAFDNQVFSMVIQPRRHRIRRPSWWDECTLPQALGIACVPRNPGQSGYATLLSDHFPDLLSLLDDELYRIHKEDLASHLVQCEFWGAGGDNCYRIPDVFEPRDAARRLARSWPEFAEIYEKKRNQSLTYRAIAYGKCDASRRYYANARDCTELTLFDDGRPLLREEEIERGRREALADAQFSVLSRLSDCRIAEQIGAPTPCIPSYHPEFSGDLEEVEAMLRADLPDFEALYEAAQAEAVARRAKRIGGELARRRFWRTARNAEADLPPDHDARWLDSVTRLIDLFPDAADLIESARHEITEQLKTLN